METVKSPNLLVEVGQLLKQDWKVNSRSYIPILTIILCATIFHILSDGTFLTPRNLSNLSRQVSVNMTLAVGMTLIILTAGIDLSVGSVLALCGMVAAISQVHWGWSELGLVGALLSFSLAIFAGACCGAFTGFAISRLNITPFIVTLGMMVICRGLTLIFSSAQAIAPMGKDLGSISSDYLSPLLSMSLFGVLSLLWIWVQYRSFKHHQKFALTFRNIFFGVILCSLGASVFCSYRGIPVMVLLVALCTLVGILALKYTRYGRFLYAIGGNREAADLSGVPVKKTLWITYLVMGALSGFAGVLDSARVNGAVPSAGELAELDAIAAVVIGGTSLMGGVGTLVGTVFGVILMGVLNNGMSLLGISEHYQKVFKGVVIILAVYLDMRSKRK